MKYNSVDRNTSDVSNLVIQEQEPSKYTKLVSFLCSCFRPAHKAVPDIDEKTPFLPEKAEEFSSKKTLVLDLDETLVHSLMGSKDGDIQFDMKVDSQSVPISVLKRPGVDEFLQKCAELFEIVVFTASVAEYADPLLDFLDQNHLISHRLYRNHCTNIKGAFIKDLNRLNRSLKDVIIVDNSPVSYMMQPHNGLPIRSWFSDKNDRELFKTWSILSELSKAQNVTSVISAIKNKNIRITSVTVLSAIVREEQIQVQEDMERGEFNSPLHKRESSITFD